MNAIFKLLVCGSLLSLVSCGKDKSDPVRTTPVEGVRAVPEGAVIRSLTLDSGSLPSGTDSYIFNSSDLFLKGSWVRTRSGQTVKLEGQTPVNDLERALVEQNVQNLRLSKIDPAKCSQGQSGGQKILTVTYTVQEQAETLKIPTVSASAYTCGDYAMPDETFDLILGAVRNKLPAPTDLNQYQPI